MPSIPFFSDLTDGTAVSLMVGVTLKKTLKDTMSATDDAYLSYKINQKILIFN